MQIKFVVPAVAFVFAACLNATVAFAQALQYIGPSSQAFVGDQGHFLSHDRCDTAFKGSTWCTSEVIIKGGPSSKAATDPSGAGEWVIPVISAGTSEKVLDFSGISTTDADNLNCTSWTSSDPADSGLVVKDAGGGDIEFDLFPCNVAKFAACCR